MSQLWNQLDDQQIAETIRDSRANQLQSCRQRIALFKGLQTEIFEERILALEKIIQVVKSYIRSSSNSNNNSHTSPSSSPNLIDTSITTMTTNVLQQEEVEEDVVIGDEDENNSDYYNEQLFYYLLTILRLSVTCPYSDVRQSCKDFLSSLKKSSTANNNNNNNVPIPEPTYNSPSHFISLHDIFSLESNSSSSNQQQAVLYPRSTNLSLSPWSTYLHHNTSQQSFNSIPSIISDYTGGRCSDEYVRQMMIKTFIDEGRLANSFRILTFFPTFFEIYHITFTKIIKQPIGPLKRTWKSYLGIMVASEQQCQYLVSTMKMDFLYNGGDPNWLLGLDYVPNKLRTISRLVLKLSRQPWRVNSDDIQQLMIMNGGGTPFGADITWTRGELVQATVIIATFLGLSSFILGCGITPEIDMTGGFLIMSGKQQQQPIESELDLPTVYFNQSMENVVEDDRFHTDHGIGLGVSGVMIEKSTEELIQKLKIKKNEEREERTSKVMIDNSRHPPPLSTTEEHYNNRENLIFENLSRFIDLQSSQEIHLERFEKYHTEYNELLLGEYCFEDHGCDLVNHYLPGIGDDLVAEFNEAISITDWSIFHPVAEEVVDTSPLRNAIWYYTQKILGVIKEDYTYDDIHTYLNDRTTQYIDDLCMSPYKIQMDDWCNIGISLRPEEKCHVNLLIASARKQAVLCYSLYLISEN
ncbi:PA26 p53-induced protein-domain-containing protein [Cokeromyces recurvatus]|uniref:PA26 p53-induced protein-domain-containing protein n=1 Tax=Cokeromyces recurvatus TaxID=90255 RepID=UPI00221E5C89|nr:PA26 p53-induced protein-domain-containing protein [Cokeromyces recurvatus]KAI7905181.1 PA26 p53-induced protein-domain-containing protein [Cokeromyces recurvatus]